MLLWTVYERGWGTGEASDRGAVAPLRLVTVLIITIHQIAEGEGNILSHRPLHRLSSTGRQWTGARPLVVPPAQLPGMLGVTMAVRHGTNCRSPTPYSPRDADEIRTVASAFLLAYPPPPPIPW